MRHKKSEDHLECSELWKSIAKHTLYSELTKLVWSREVLWGYSAFTSCNLIWNTGQAFEWQASPQLKSWWLTSWKRKSSCKWQFFSFSSKHQALKFLHKLSLKLLKVQAFQKQWTATWREWSCRYIFIYQSCHQNTECAALLWSICIAEDCTQLITKQTMLS